MSGRLWTYARLRASLAAVAVLMGAVTAAGILAVAAVFNTALWWSPCRPGWTRPGPRRRDVSGWSRQIMPKRLDAILCLSKACRARAADLAPNPSPRKTLY